MAIALGIATSPESQTIGNAGLDPMTLNGKLRRLCGLFVFTNNSKVYLIHQTAREFLIQKQNVMSRPVCTYWSSLCDAEHLMAQICVRYLLMEDLKKEEDERSRATGFFQYSAENWGEHVRKTELTEHGEMPNQLRQIYDTTTWQFKLWFRVIRKTMWKLGLDNDGTGMTALHLAALFGHEQEVRYFLSKDTQGIGIDKPDSTGASPLFWASLNGHGRVVSTLLEWGADVNRQGGEYGTALQAACFQANKGVVQILVEHDADVNIQSGFFGNALRAACFGGNPHIAHFLLEKGADINGQAWSFESSFHVTCFRGNEGIVQILLQHGVDVNEQCKRFGGAIQAACHGGNDGIIRILLEHGADINAWTRSCGNALQVACRRRDEGMVQMLLDHGAEVNGQSAHYGNALQAACRKGNAKIVQTLLDHGADVHQQGHYADAFGATNPWKHYNVIETLRKHTASSRVEG